MKVRKLLSVMLIAALMAPAVPAHAEPAAAQGDGENTAYLFAYFRDNNQENLCYGVSRDGYRFRTLNRGAATFESTLGTRHLRDPFLFRGEDGYFYIVVTDMDSSKGWTSQSTVAIYKTKDLIHIDDSVLIDYKNFEGFEDCNRAWAPQVIWCPEHQNDDGSRGAYMIYLALQKQSTAGEIGTVMYKHFAVDLMDAGSYTEPQFMMNGEENGDFSSTGAIDGDIIYDTVNHRYLMYFDGVRVAACDTIDGMYTELSENGEGIYQGVSPFTSYRSEGSNIFKLNNEDKWIYCADGDAFGTGYLVFETTDFVNYKQIGGKGSSEILIDYNFTPRHGYVIPISEEELQALFDEYGEVDLEPEDTGETLSRYVNLSNKVFDIADTYPDYPSDWTLPAERTLDDNTYHYLGINGELRMGDGYGAGREWTAIQFDMAANSYGDTILRDTDGKAVVGYCYASGSDGFWVGHGERSFGGTVSDRYGIKRLPNYLKTDVAGSSLDANTGHVTYAQHDICTMIMENAAGAVDGTDYTGDYYTVRTYVRGDLVSTEYYSGHFNGLGSIECTRKQYYGQFCIYSRTEQRPDMDTDDPHLLFAMNFNGENAEAQKGKAVIHGGAVFGKSNDGSDALVLDGASTYISATNSDGTPLLRGKKNAVITMYAEMEKPSTMNGWYFYTSWSDRAQNAGSRSYVGLYGSGSDGTTVAERYRNDSGTPQIVGKTGFQSWHQITYILDGNNAELYIDGKYAGSETYQYDLDTVLGSGDDIVTYFGKANWQSGEYAKGMFDDIAVYDFGPGIQLGDLNGVQEDLDLPTASEETDGYSMTWESSDPSVISTEGHVTIPQEGKKKVTLTATISFGNTVLKRNFDAVVKAADYCDLTLDISAERGIDIQDNMYGMFFEDINYAADGGLYAELVENRSFEQVSTTSNRGKETAPKPGYAWYAVSGDMQYLTNGGLNEQNPTYLEFTGTSFRNKAYSGMYIEQGKKYRVSFYARSADYTGAVSAKTVKDGTEGFSGVIAESVTGEWKKYEKEVTAQNTVRYSDFILELSSEGTVDFDMISVMPSDAVCGVFRKDLAEKLKAASPGFLRFPGGCVVEGYDLSDRYQWKNSVGPVEERVQNWNRWAADSAYHDYNQTLGLGFYEYFELCEYLGCDPLPVLSVGLACEFQSNQETSFYEPDGQTYTDEFKGYIQDALDLVEFANSTDFENSEWAALRRSMGHEEPFHLTMIGIGNEQWQTATNRWYERYEAFEKEIHKVYPDMKLIATSGPNAGGSGFDEAWRWIRGNQAENASFAYAVDEHYYMSPEWFLENDGRYDQYDRGTKVFAGEYAANGAYGNTLYSAIAEAAFMTGLERNADVVFMASYAPLLARIGYNQWYPDLIWFDDVTSYGTPDYYVQSMYANNTGDYTLQTSASGEDKSYQTVSFDSDTGDIIVKIVNPYEYEQKTGIHLDPSFQLTGTADAWTLTGTAYTDTNSIEDPEKIAPVAEQIKGVSGDMTYTVPARAFTVLRIHTGKGIVSLTDKTASEHTLSYELTANGDLSGYDIYVALYREDGSLAGVKKNELRGSFESDAAETGKLKVMVWNKDTMQPAQAAITSDAVQGTHA